MIGEIYLKLKVIESVRLEFDGSAHQDTKVSQRVDELYAHIEGKYDL